VLYVLLEGATSDDDDDDDEEEDDDGDEDEDDADDDWLYFKQLSFVDGFTVIVFIYSSRFCTSFFETIFILSQLK
jgi:hypothetical protein